jgi:hypothetical protein
MTYEEKERKRLQRWLDLAVKKLPLERLKVLAEHACWYLDQECGQGHYEAYCREEHGETLEVVHKRVPK